jgi:hypothetical protein
LLKDKKEKIKKDEDIYDDEQREALMEEDAITPEEDGFMDGYVNPKAAENLLKTERKKLK